MKRKQINKNKEILVIDGVCDCDDIDRENRCRHLVRMCPFPFCTHRDNKHSKLGTMTRKSIRSSFSHFDNDPGLDGEPGHRYVSSASGSLRITHGWTHKTNKHFIFSCGMEYWNNDEWIYLDSFRQRMRIEFRNRNRPGTPLAELKWVSSKIDRDNNGIISNMDEISATINKYKILV